MAVQTCEAWRTADRATSSSCSNAGMRNLFLCWGQISIASLHCSATSIVRRRSSAILAIFPLACDQSGDFCRASSLGHHCSAGIQQSSTSKFGSPFVRPNFFGSKRFSDLIPSMTSVGRSPATQGAMTVTSSSRHTARTGRNGAIEKCRSKSSFKLS